MNLKTYYRAVEKKDGKDFIKDVAQVVRGLGFKPNEIVICRNIGKVNPSLLLEAEQWLDEMYPDTVYYNHYDGLDWYFEEPEVALMFKLRWC